MIKLFSAALILMLLSASNVFADSKVIESTKTIKKTAETPDAVGSDVEVTTETKETEVEEAK